MLLNPVDTYSLDDITHLNKDWIADKVPIGRAIDGNELFIVKSVMVENSEGSGTIAYYIILSFLCYCYSYTYIYIYIYIYIYLIYNLI
jgi:hypothetical protein